ncbi:MAG: hypothetical protein ACREV8_09915, partial [Gammaproteobacteria bacterium]
MSEIDRIFSEAAAADEDEPAAEDKSSRKKRSQATELVSLAESLQAEFFRTPDHRAFASVQLGDHRETWPIGSRAFRRLLQAEHYKLTGQAVGGQAVQDAIGVLEGRGLFGSSEQEVRVRVAEHDGRIYLDLADDRWRAVEVSATGWRVTDSPPVRFRRAPGMQSLPVPVPGGNLEELRQFLNTDEAAWPLVLAFLLACYRSEGPFPLLVLLGGAGRAKTTTARVLRRLVDPNESPARAEPRNLQDLMIAARNSQLICFDNISSVRDWLSDGLCRLATGGGFSARELYSDDGEVILDAVRPVILTSITEIATRGDLLDRALLVYLPEIRERVTESDFWEKFDKALPCLLGALLDAVSAGLRNLPNTTDSDLPRMADFARWVRATGAVPDFDAAYFQNREQATS